MAKAKEFEFKAEMKQLLNLIVHSLYTNHEIFLRELVSNSSDALNKIRFRSLTDRNMIDPDHELKIKIELDKENQTFSIEDTGIGMTREELIDQLGTVASSGTLSFLNQMKDDKSSLDANLIGQFGVGFYSVFMVADEVTVETRNSDPDSKAYRWVSSGQDTFQIEEIDRTERGTKVFFKLKDEFKEFSEDYRIKDVLKKYSNFVDFPLYIGDEKVNMVSALWHKKKEDVKDEERDEFYKFITNDYDTPLGYLHLSIEGNINFKSMLFIPKNAPAFMFNDIKDKTLHLYSNRVFIQDNANELLPDYMRFVKGVVDTEDLPLNVSREVTQNSPVMAKIRNVLVSKILGQLEDWAENDNDKYLEFFRTFGSIFKTGVNSDFTNKDKIIDLLRFETTALKKDELCSLKDYVERMKEGQKEIFYLSGDSRESLELNPNLEYFRKKDIEVVLLSDPVDVFTFPYILNYKDKELKSIEKADLELEKEDQEQVIPEDSAKSLLEAFKVILGDKVEDVIESKRLVDSPVTLVLGKEGMDKQMEKMMQMMDKGFSTSKRILEINLSHPLISNLSVINENDSESPVLKDSVNQLYEGALLMEGYLKSPNEFIKRMTEFMVKSTDKK